MADKQWKILDAAPDDFSMRFLEYPKPVLDLLYQRGLRTQSDIDEFMHPDYRAHVGSPYLLQDMEKAVSRIFDAISREEKIIIYGDYDADGICGSVILYSALSELGANFDVYIPDRFHEGYGLNEKALLEIAKGDDKLIITVDCGVTDVEEIAIARARGIDVIIVDHHLIPPKEPAAYAIINPKRTGETYPFRFFCATGLAFKVACALFASERAKPFNLKEGAEKWLLDVAAIGTVADMVPLVGENRTLVTYGLTVIEKTKRLGLKLLIDFEPQRMAAHARSPDAEKITSRTIAFSIAPRINATSRMAHATTSFELLITQSEEMARNLVAKVEDLNNGRRRMVDKILKEAEEMLAEIVAREGVMPFIICLGKDDWVPGVAGLVSGRLTEKYGRPSFIFGRVHDHYKGSCRSVGDLNIVELMRLCDERNGNVFREFGGHAMAGGVAIAPENIEKLKACPVRYGEEDLREKDLRPILCIDLEMRPDDISWELFDWLVRLEPYGEGDKKPLFLMRKAGVASYKAGGKKEDQVKMKMKGDPPAGGGVTKFFDCIGFGLSHKMENVRAGDRVDVVFELEANEWNGTRELQLNIKDIRKS